RNFDPTAKVPTIITTGVVIAQDGSDDYEAELTFAISKDGRHIREDSVLGYTCGNNVCASAFKNQWSFSKEFDPIGLVLASPGAIGHPEQLVIQRILNGAAVHDSNTKYISLRILLVSTNGYTSLDLQGSRRSSPSFHKVPPLNGELSS
ncbi:LOW QUALITY PROTEIN: hypothetical protein N5P37_011384, partial [Trichoderma harzianum]